MFSTRRTVLALVSLASAVAAQQDQPSQEELRARYDAKLAAPFVANADWRFDLSAARAGAFNASAKALSFSKTY